ncbi:bile acid:sodium symporter family protein [Anaerobacillus alkaliphilus]|uniref:bile acid:sodium symporter family protein n=1 Tax=Anaerobacillus alkaliphilus TaxID=1548597 RepID=UPI001375CDFD|nr:bile acid:sodium symporter family protein [Anaerobacillus alkaliphilus]
MTILKMLNYLITKFMPFWIVSCGIVAYLFPSTFLSLERWPGPALALIIFLMGLSLPTTQFIAFLKKPKLAFLGILLKWLLTVSIAVVLALVFFRNSPELATGIILAGAVPGGTSANLYTFMANGTTALSITMSAIDTVIGPFLTPLVIKAFAGQLIYIAFWPLFFKMVYIVFLPILAGLLIQWKWGKSVYLVKPLVAPTSAVALFIIVLATVSSAQQAISLHMSLMPLLVFVVLLQVIGSMAAGYYVAKLFRFQEGEARAMLFQTGICNTALAALLAMNYISPLAAIPAVIAVVINLTLGSIMAIIFMKHDIKQKSTDFNVA